MSDPTEFEEALFSAAIALAPELRRPFLERACGSDSALRSRLEILLNASDQPGGALDTPPAAALPEIAKALEQFTPPDESAGTRVGRYKLLQKIGEGGFGVVWMADQTEPIHRRVALKVIKLGMDTREVIARFEAERQALALMDHPNIARVLDAGATETGRPFFAMELVHGTPITHYCDENNLGTAARLRLFVQVCHAIQHAHQKGIIHRDLKPSNILVAQCDGEATPKVIDFGIAKATQGRLTDRTLFTAFEHFIGTPAYVSPEQTETGGMDVDTRSDIYSLGVLLYELLTGRTPFESRQLQEAGMDRMRQIIREVEPPRPSTRVSGLDAATRTTVARQRAVEPAKLPALLRGDLDWIVMRCLEKKRSRRYESADGLALDLQRHLANEPVVARPTGTAYLVARFVRRHRFGVTAIGSVLASLVLGLVFTATALQRERTARERADTEAVRSAQVAGFLEKMLTGVGPEVALGRDPRLLRAILDETVERMRTELRGQPEVEAGLRTTLGDIYRDIGEFPKAVLMHETALELRRQVHGEEHAAVADSLHKLGDVLGRQGRLPEAEAALRRALALREKLFGPENSAVAETRAVLAQILRFGTGARPPSAADLSVDERAALLPKAGEGACPPVQTVPDESPLVIRMGHTGGRAGAQNYNAGNVLSTVHQLGALESEFSADGIRIEWSYHSGGPTMNDAQARGVIDIASDGPGGVIGGRMGGIKRRLLMRVGANGHGFDYIVVRADSPFKSMADLRGRRFATILGAGGHIVLCRILEKNGIGVHEVQFVNLDSAAAVLTATATGEADANVMARPADLLTQKKVRIVYDGTNDPDLGIGGGCLSVSEEFERKYPAIVQRVVNVLVKTAAWCSDEANRDAAFALWEKAGVSREEMQRNWSAMPLDRRYSPLLDSRFLAELRRYIDDARRFEGIDASALDDLESWTEPKYLARAIEELRLQDRWIERDADGETVGGAGL